MKTAWLIVLVMAVATVYLFDVRGARRPMHDAYAEVSGQVQRVVSAVRSSLPSVPEP